MRVAIEQRLLTLPNDAAPVEKRRSQHDEGKLCTESPIAKRRRLRHKQTAPPAFRSSRKRAEKVEYDEYPMGGPPRSDRRQLFFGLMNAREVVARSRAKGIEGKALYDLVPAEFAAYLRRWICPNVRRRQDRTTRGMHKICAAARRLALCRSEAEVRRLKQLIVFNFGLWRFVGGTVAFAAEVGFLSCWDESAKKAVRQIVHHAFEEGRVSTLFSIAYAAPGNICKALAGTSDPAALEAVLYNTGPRAVLNKEPAVTYYSLVGKFKVMDKLWQLSENIVQAAEPDSKTGATCTKPVADVLGHVPFFGTNENRGRAPTFFAKELVQDLLDTPVFAGGRANAVDLQTYCPAGPGAIEGLRLMYGVRGKLTQSECIPMMRGILRTAGEPGGWQFDDLDTLELHDIQFMLCELQKFWHRKESLRNYPGPRACFCSRADTAFWSARLEDAVALQVLQPCGLDFDAIAFTLAGWLGIEVDAPWIGRKPKGVLCSGDRVTFRSCGGSSTYFTLLRETECALMAASQPGVSSATPFRLERPCGAGPLKYGEPMFLRAPSGAHLGPKATGGGFEASETSERYAEARHLTFLPCGSACLGDVIQSGSSILLMPYVPKHSSSSAHGSMHEVCVEFDEGAVNLARQVVDVVGRVVQAGFDNGTLLVDDDRLSLHRASEIRGRLIGS